MRQSSGPMKRPVQFVSCTSCPRLAAIADLGHDRLKCRVTNFVVAWCSRRWVALAVKSVESSAAFLM